jgi:hypothetical protein
MIRSVPALTLPIVAALSLTPLASADIFDPLEFFLAHAPGQNEDTQAPNARWTFRRGTDQNGDLLIGDANVACEAGFFNWSTPGGDYGFTPSVGPRLSPNEARDQSNSWFTPEFDGLLFLPGSPARGNAVAVFTANQPTPLPAMKLRAEVVYYASDGVSVSVKTRISGQTKVWLDAAAVPAIEEGFEKWTLFAQNAPTLQQGDKHWVEVKAGPNNDTSGDWTNISLESAACPADLNGDGVLDLFDFLQFTNLFNAQDPEADCDGDTGLSLFDFLCFTNQFNAGC